MWTSKEGTKTKGVARLTYRVYLGGSSEQQQSLVVGLWVVGRAYTLHDHVSVELALRHTHYRNTNTMGNLNSSSGNCI